MASLLLHTGLAIGFEESLNRLELNLMYILVNFECDLWQNNDATCLPGTKYWFVDTCVEDVDFIASVCRCWWHISAATSRP